MLPNITVQPNKEKQVNKITEKFSDQLFIILIIIYNGHLVLACVIGNHYRTNIRHEDKEKRVN
jgi:predicted lipase